jgi:hypothetical protein
MFPTCGGREISKVTTMNGVWALSDSILWIMTEVAFAPVILLGLLALAFAGARIFLHHDLD